MIEYSGSVYTGADVLIYGELRPSGNVLVKGKITSTALKNNISYTVPSGVDRVAINYVNTLSISIKRKTGGIFNTSMYTLPYIKDKKVMCNKESDTLTAYYAGVDCGEKVNQIYSSFIFEDISTKQESGTVALILEANGLNRVTQITDLSLHCVIKNNLLKVDILGNKFGTEYYYEQNIINQTISLIADGKTKHDVVLYAKLNSGIVDVTIDGNTYSGNFTPNERISSLNEVVGNYAIFEHYCSGDMNSFAMPMFTCFAVKNVNGYVIVRDYFEREDGLLMNAPTGQPYHMFNSSDFAYTNSDVFK